MDGATLCWLIVATGPLSAAADCKTSLHLMLTGVVSPELQLSIQTRVILNHCETIMKFSMWGVTACNSGSGSGSGYWRRNYQLHLLILLLQQGNRWSISKVTTNVRRARDTLFASSWISTTSKTSLDLFSVLQIHFSSISHIQSSAEESSSQVLNVFIQELVSQS